MNLREDVSFFIGGELQQICFGLYQLQLHFTGDVHIECYYQVNFSNKNMVIEWSGYEGRRQVSFNCLLEQKITEAKFDTNEERLTLVFGEIGMLVLIRDMEERGESYVVHLEKDFEVV